MKYAKKGLFRGLSGLAGKIMVRPDLMGLPAGLVMPDNKSVPDNKGVTAKAWCPGADFLK